MTLRRQPLLFTLTWLVLTAGSSAALAQEGKISGVVRDELGDAIPGVTIVVLHQATKASQSATTGTDGRYSFALPPGSYSVAATLASFQRVLQVVQL